MKKIAIIFTFIICLNSIIIHQILVRTSSQNTSTNDTLSEEILDDEPFKVEDYFNILTLTEKYGDELTSMLHLDSEVISYDDLRYLEVLHVGFDGQIYQGELIVHESVSTEVLQIFRDIYDVGFPIEKMKVISEYGYSDNDSMLDNNTSAFNFRKITNSDQLSNHALGLAIDINPKINPYVIGNTILPENATEFADRNQITLGMIKKGEAVHEIFTKYGWSWGGDWHQPKDYQHFEKITN